MVKIAHLKAKLISTAIIIGVIWLFFLISLIFPGLANYGIIPRSSGGLVGILLSPLLHADFGHLLSNTIPLSVFIFVLLIFYERMAFGVIAGSVLIGGLLVWIIARDANHIGASGLIYSLAAFLITSGLIRKKWMLLLVAVILGIGYSGLIWGIIPGIAGPNVSWEAHLCGASAGVALAFMFKPVPPSNAEAAMDSGKK